MPLVTVTIMVVRLKPREPCRQVRLHCRAVRAPFNLSIGVLFRSDEKRQHRRQSLTNYLHQQVRDAEQKPLQIDHFFTYKKPVEPGVYLTVPIVPRNGPLIPVVIGLTLQTTVVPGSNRNPPPKSAGTLRRGYQTSREPQVC